MAGISISGLVSGSFDWKSVVDQLIEIDSAPIARLQTEEAKNIDRLASFEGLKIQLTALQTSAKALAADGLFNGRTATSSTTGSNWTLSAADDAQTGTYTVAVTNLATATRRNGTSSISDGLSTTSDVSGVTLASMPTATAVTAGTFTVNGKQVTIALTDSLQDVFDAISTATGGVVSGSYNATTDKITLASNNASEVVLGAANDSSNFLAALRLSNNGTDSTTSTATLGSVSTSATLANSRLSGIGAIATSGTFTINGESIAYDVTTDTLSTLLTRINASNAGVTATYDNELDRVVLTNDTTGDVGLGTAEASSGLLDILGLGSASTLVRGENTEFTVNGGSTRTSLSTTLDETALGVTGLSVTVNSTGSQQVSVSADTASMTTAISTFISNFNAVQSYIESETKIKVGADGKVTAALLSDNREVQTWSSQLRSLAFSEVSGLSGTIKRLENLGIDFNSTDSTLAIRDQTKLDTALASKSDEVAAFFNTATTGFADLFDDFLTPKLDTSTGAVKMQMDTLNKANTSIDEQIKTLTARLENQRELLTNAFLAMQTAQSQAQQQQKTLTDMFATKSDS